MAKPKCKCYRMLETNAEGIKSFLDTMVTSETKNIIQNYRHAGKHPTQSKPCDAIRQQLLCFFSFL